ncbi:LysR family transcriptional regulator [Allonocardiopsis opalescens]|uniref:DNA-binding transcriptional LysR family regulator n=1 Tax=Allonocardiopsis opalescens TaxID=1144618 RepID=A0A2T0Q2X5_9ACTN|nr:LysR family transcriptional regulator [Allonocardiopsis opalescens]PRX98145.1 DNA-binding transcriptional LysR family regulator [Allonocardiopsis opalescens]
MDLTLRQLSVFVAVARAASFTAAAGELHVSQSSLSRTVADMERVVGARLLRRDTRNVEVTDEGAELLEIAEHILAVHRAGMRQLARYQQGGRGTVTVAALPSVAGVLLPAVLPVFREHWPDISVRILDGLARSVVDSVAAGDADFAITVSEGLPDWLDRRPLVRDRFGAVFPRGHRLAAAESVRWADIAGERFIAMGASSSVRAFTDAAFTQAGVRAGGVVEASNIVTVGGLVAAQLGVSALPSLVRALLGFADIEQRPLVEPVVDRQLDVVLPTDRALPPAARRFLELLEDLRRSQAPLPEDVTWS